MRWSPNGLAILQLETLHKDELETQTSVLNI